MGIGVRKCSIDILNYIEKSKNKTVRTKEISESLGITNRDIKNIIYDLCKIGILKRSCRKDFVYISEDWLKVDNDPQYKPYYKKINEDEKIKVMIEINDSIKMKKCPKCSTSDTRILVDNNDPDFIIVYCNKCGYKKEFRKLWIQTSVDFNDKNKIVETNNIAENTLSENNAPLCKCNCGGKVSWSKQRKRWNDYIHGHNSQRTLGPNIKKLILH